MVLHYAGTRTRGNGAIGSTLVQWEPTSNPIRHDVGLGNVIVAALLTGGPLAPRDGLIRNQVLDRRTGDQ